MLNWIADDLETSQTKLEQVEKAKGLADETPTESAATLHGAIRFTDHFTLSQVFAEFRALRASVIRLWSRGRSITDNEELLELIRFNEAIDQAVAQSVQRFSSGIEDSRNIFTAILGHDLRNPLSAIMTGAMYLEKLSPKGSDVADVAKSTLTSSLRMQDLINDLLDVSRKHLGGQLPMSPSKVDLAEVCGEVVREITLVQPELQITCDAKGDTVGQWDRGRMAQVISNLVGNARHYGDTKRPISVSMQGKGAGVELVVHNWGQAIPPGSLHEIFEPTKRLHVGQENAKQGGSLGLGLYIVNLVVEAHGGTVDVTSSEEAGTAFTVHLPRNLPRATTLHTPEVSLR